MSDDYLGIPLLRAVPDDVAQEAAYHIYNSPDWVQLTHYFLADVQRAQLSMTGLNPFADEFKEQFHLLQREAAAKGEFLQLITRMALAHKSRQELDNA